MLQFIVMTFGLSQFSVVTVLGLLHFSVVVALGLLQFSVMIAIGLLQFSVIDAGVDRVDKYCDRLQDSLDVMHVEIADAELKKQRLKTVKEANNRLTHRFEVP